MRKTEVHVGKPQARMGGWTPRVPGILHQSYTTSFVNLGQKINGKERLINSCRLFHFGINVHTVYICMLFRLRYQNTEKKQTYKQKEDEFFCGLSISPRARKLKNPRKTDKILSSNK